MTSCIIKHPINKSYHTVNQSKTWQKSKEHSLQLKNLKEILNNTSYICIGLNATLLSALHRNYYHLDNGFNPAIPHI